MVVERAGVMMTGLGDVELRHQCQSAPEFARAAAVVAGVAAAGRVAIGSAADPILAGVPGGLRAPLVAVGQWADAI
jgi:hypothetical protein